LDLSPVAVGDHNNSNNSNNKSSLGMKMKKQKESVLNAEWKIRVKHPTVETADSHSSQVRAMRLTKMPDKKTFDEHVEDVRDDDKNDHQQRVEELERVAEQKETKPLYARLSRNQKLGIGTGAVLVIGFFGAVSNPTQPFLGFSTMGVLTMTALLLTISKHGVAFRKEASENMEAFRKEVSENMETPQQQNQQQTKMGSSQVEQIVCQNCGWKNPKTNNYCHDCGNEL
jgi:muramoyltetrapeptide carboxypeptidase LdcA involved in peptidoglycan recycling